MSSAKTTRLPAEPGCGAPRGAGDEAGTHRRSDFIGFRQRLERLVSSLVALRHVATSPESWDTRPERVQVTLDAKEVRVEFTVTQLSWETITQVASLFQQTFAGFEPLFAEHFSPRHVRFAKADLQKGSYGRFVVGDGTTLAISQPIPKGTHTVEVRTGFTDFNDHFETFATDTARHLFPRIEPPPHKAAGNIADWHKQFGRQFDELGCHVLRDHAIGWNDLVGLERVRERLQRAVLLPLVREALYQKVAGAVLPPGRTLLPRGVLLTGPPGTGKTWSMRALAGEAGIPVVALPCDALMTKWYGESERTLAEVFRVSRRAGRMILFIDEIDALTRRRQDSHETTARLVSILLAELDGLAGSSEVLLVGSANATEAIDPAVLDRFDVTVAFELPNPEQRRLALAYYARHLPAGDVADLAERMVGWSFRRLSRFAESVVRSYVSGLDVSHLEAREPALPCREDYEREMAHM
jgi:hypothetical protein